MKRQKSKGKKMVLQKENPVAQSLSNGQYRLQVKPSIKVYKRAKNKRIERELLNGGKDPRSPLTSSGWSTGVLLAKQVA